MRFPILCSLLMIVRGEDDERDGDDERDEGEDDESDNDGDEVEI